MDEVILSLDFLKVQSKCTKITVETAVGRVAEHEVFAAQVIRAEYVIALVDTSCSNRIPLMRLHLNSLP